MGWRLGFIGGILVDVVLVVLRGIAGRVEYLEFLLREGVG